MKEYYRKLICELVNKVHSEEFLRRIYVSLRDYVKEKGGAVNE